MTVIHPLQALLEASTYPAESDAGEDPEQEIEEIGEEDNGVGEEAVPGWDEDEAREEVGDESDEWENEPDDRCRPEPGYPLGGSTGRLQVAHLEPSKGIFNQIKTLSAFSYRAISRLKLNSLK